MKSIRLSKQLRTVLSQEELELLTRECIESWIQEEIDLNEDDDTGSINERVCNTIDTYLNSLHNRLSYSTFLFLSHKRKVKDYRVTASSISTYETVIQATSQEEAERIARETDGGDFAESSPFGDWKIEEVICLEEDK